MRLFTTRSGNLKWCVFSYLRWGQPNLQIWAVYGNFRGRPIWGQQKSDFSQIVPEPCNCAFCVSCSEGSPNLQMWAQYGDFRFWYIWAEEKSEFSQLVPQTSNTAFCICYAESSLSCNFQLNTAILDFDRFEVMKSPIFLNSSRRPQIVRFVLLTLRPA